MANSELEAIPCSIWRGGTSKAVFLLENDLPVRPEERDRVILSIFGSPDARQIDGLGGADPLTSKLAVIGPASRAGADIDYTFGQVDIRRPFVDYSSNCGNISSAVGPFAIVQGLVRAAEPVTTVRINNTNTGKIFEAEVPMAGGRPAVLGDYRISGVPGTGARIMLNLAGTIGSKTGKLLPTGNPKDVIRIDGLGDLTVSLVDAASPMVFVLAEDLGLSGTETPAEVDSNSERLELLEKIRCRAALRMGMVKSEEEARQKVRAVPMVAFVAPPRKYRVFSDGREISADEVDFVSRVMFMQVMHKAYSGTATACTGSAAVTPGTIVNSVMRRHRDSRPVRIGHPGGVIEADMRVGDGKITRAAIGRTARLIMEGRVYVPRGVLP
ncbi:MAG: 3-methylitaconate isomerase [Planctomycetota bacterium]|jgi:2-methylaconitate cis-trans-isomerase PrpF|nr:3-methylitaconate isomerase [Planctomycetota bacterium]